MTKKSPYGTTIPKGAKSKITINSIAKKEEKSNG